MADISVTAASVAMVSGATSDYGTAGAAITAGQLLYMDASASNAIKLCDNDASQAAADCIGIALHAAASGQPVRFCNGGDLIIGATLVQGKVYVNSVNAGGIAPVADLGSGQYSKVVGIAKTTGILTVSIIKATGLPII
jgi:Uncharacterized conserved protein (DUF2190)